MQNSRKTKRDMFFTRRSSINCNFLNHMITQWGIKNMTRKSMMYWIKRWIGISSTLKARWSRTTCSARVFQSSYPKNSRNMSTINTKEKGAQMSKRLKSRKRTINLLKRKRRLTQFLLFNLLRILRDKIWVCHQQKVQMLPMVSLRSNRSRQGKFVPKQNKGMRKIVRNSLMKSTRWKSLKTFSWIRNRLLRLKKKSRDWKKRRKKKD